MPARLYDVRVTSQPQPSPEHSPDYNSVSAGAASDAKAFFAAALLTFASGMVVLIGFIMAGGFGVLLGIVFSVPIAIVIGERYGRMLPRDLSAGALIALTVGSFLMFFLAAGMAA